MKEGMEEMTTDTVTITRGTFVRGPRDGTRAFLVLSAADPEGVVALWWVDSDCPDQSDGYLDDVLLVGGPDQYTVLQPDEWPDWAHFAIGVRGLEDDVSAAYGGYSIPTPVEGRVPDEVIDATEVMELTPVPADFPLAINALRERALLSYEIWRITAQGRPEEQVSSYLNGMRAMSRLIGYLDRLEEQPI